MSEFFRVHFQTKNSENSDSVFCMRALELRSVKGVMSTDFFFDASDQRVNGGYAVAAHVSPCIDPMLDDGRVLTSTAAAATAAAMPGRGAPIAGRWRR